MRIFLAALLHETNCFSPLPTTLRSFRENGLLHRPGDVHTKARADATQGYGDALKVFKERGDEVVTGLCAWAMPSGLVARQSYESLRDELLDGLDAAGQVDAVFLFLHGAMMAEGYPDCEGDLLSKMRARFGAKLPIGVLLDLHGNVSLAMVESGALLVACKEYPHTDYLPRTRELAAMLNHCVTTGRAPLCLMQRVPMVAPLGTTEDPMRSFVDSLQDMEGVNGVISISVMHGFAWSDTKDMGASIVVVHEHVEAARFEAMHVATTLATRLFALRESGLSNRLPLQPAMDAALAAIGQGGPVVFADSSDNPGGGAACDSTFVLQELFDRGIGNVAFGMLWDPQAALLASDAGVGARLPLRIGGKVGPQSGHPIDVSAEVLAVSSDVSQGGLDGQVGEPMGLTVAIRVAGIEIVINSIRQQTFSPNCFTDLGIDLSSKAIVVVKSSQHFRQCFDPIARATVYCNAPGSLNFDLTNLPYMNIRRPIWPLDDIDADALAGALS